MEANFGDLVKSVFDWKFVILGASSSNNKGPSPIGGGIGLSVGVTGGCERTFFLGLGRTKIFQYNGTGRGNPWQKTDEAHLKFELPAGSLIYAEVVQEMRGEFKAMRRVKAVHVIDVLFIGGEDVRMHDFKYRSELVHMLVSAVNKRVRSNYVVLRAKPVYGLERLEAVMSELQMRLLKGARRPAVTMDVQDGFDDMPR